MSDGAELNMQNKKGLTPVHVSANKGHADFVKMLLSNDCRLDTQVGRSILIS